MTERQRDVYAFIRELLRDGGICPSLQAITDAFDLKSKARTKRIVDALIAAGKLRRTAARTHNLALPDARTDIGLFSTAELQGELARRRAPERPPQTLPRGTATRPCAADGCDGRVGRGHSLCRGHWFQLPFELREELIQAQRHHRRLATRSSEHDYQDAWRRACDILEGQPA